MITATVIVVCTSVTLLAWSLVASGARADTAAHRRAVRVSDACEQHPSLQPIDL